MIGTIAWRKGVQDALDVLAARIAAGAFLDPSVLPGLHAAYAAVLRLYERDRDGFLPGEIGPSTVP